MTTGSPGRLLRRWLLLCAGMIAAMVLVGGLTRLTHSGLSIVEWKPISGVLPPLSQEAWVAEFEHYKQYPEFTLVHSHFQLADFKAIFWFEYVHRLLGRLTGLVFGAPLLWFVAKKAIRRGLALRLGGLFLLGGLQGFIGWWMVRSGLADRPDVSAVRLAIHLGMALLLYVGILWTALDQRDGDPAPLASPALARAATALWAGVLLTALAGALVAGNDGGLTYNTFPRMGDGLVPPGLLAMTPWWLNPLRNPVTAQFDHRVLAISLATAVLGFRLAVSRAGIQGPARRAADLLVGVVLAQVSLGIATLLSVVWLPLASAHQLTALLLLTAATWQCHTLWRPRGAPLPATMGEEVPQARSTGWHPSETASARP